MFIAQIKLFSSDRSELGCCNASVGPVLTVLGNVESLYEMILGDDLLMRRFLKS
jgi:hypothetical protein